jgi:cholesterol transport system auxiliary component
MNRPLIAALCGWRLGGAALALLLASGCSALKPFTTPAQQPAVYSLAESPLSAATAPDRTAATALTLIVSAPHAAAGFDSPRMMYLRQPDQLQYFAHNEWIDTPARMLAPLIVSAVNARGAFRAVVQTPSPATGEMRLDTEILRLQHEFISVPSQIRLTLRAYLVETATRRVISSREFEATVAAPSEDPRGGVTAAHQAVNDVLKQLADFCARTATAEAARGVAPATAR